MTDKTIKRCCQLLALLMTVSAATLSAQNKGKRWQRKADTFAPKTFQIVTTQEQQTIEHFGASDAWSMLFLGLWPEDQQRQIADWLFSCENDVTGKPKGIGLSLWRMNLGAGSWEQGDSAQINPGTRTECLLQPDGTWDWTKQQGQRRFLKLAKERGVPYLLLFCNSAPVQFTKNGLATNTGRDGTINLKDNCFDDFASFLAKATKGIEEHDGVRIDYVSPVNEPDGHWNWLGPKQEGSPATNREISRLAKETSKAFKKDKLQTEIVLNESSDIRCLLGTYMAGWERGNTISTLFTKDSAKISVNGLPNIPNIVLGHSYWANTPVDTMRSIRLRLRDTLAKHNLKYWQSEICIMGNDEEIGGGGNYDFSMKTALYVARVMHYDLVYGNACSWSWWRACGGNYKDGLIRIYSDDGMKTGHAVDSKLMWAMGNYSRFVRPGAVRLSVKAYDKDGNEVSEGDTRPYGAMLSAYRNKDGKLAVVAINYSESLLPISIKVDGNGRNWKLYRTSDISAESLAPVGTAGTEITLTPRSITTLVEETD